MRIRSHLLLTGHDDALPWIAAEPIKSYPGAAAAQRLIDPDPGAEALYHKQLDRALRGYGPAIQVGQSRIHTYALSLSASRQLEGTSADLVCLAACLLPLCALDAGAPELLMRPRDEPGPDDVMMTGMGSLRLHEGQFDLNGALDLDPAVLAQKARNLAGTLRRQPAERVHVILPTDHADAIAAELDAVEMAVTPRIHRVDGLPALHGAVQSVVRQSLRRAGGKPSQEVAVPTPRCVVFVLEQGHITGTRVESGMSAQEQLCRLVERAIGDLDALTEVSVLGYDSAVRNAWKAESKGSAFDLSNMKKAPKGGLQRHIGHGAAAHLALQEAERFVTNWIESHPDGAAPTVVHVSAGLPDDLEATRTAVRRLQATGTLKGHTDVFHVWAPIKLLGTLALPEEEEGLEGFVRVLFRLSSRLGDSERRGLYVVDAPVSVAALFGEDEWSRT